MRSRLIILITLAILLLLGIGTDAQEYHYNLHFRLTPQDFADTISIEVDHGRIYLPVTIGGETYRFLLDTGASMGAVYTDSPIKGIETVGRITSHDATGQARPTWVVRLPAIQIGKITITDYHANQLSQPPTPSKSDGIIGFDIFNKGLLGKIDVKNQRLILTDRKNFFRQEPGYEARYRLRRHVPFVSLCPFGNYYEEVRFDTGDRALYTISKHSYEQGSAEWGEELQHQVEGQTVGSLRVSHFGTEASGEVTALCLDRLRWGDFSFRSVRTLTAYGQSSIGSAILGYGSVIINPRRNRLVFQAYTGGWECVIDNRLPDIYYVPDHGQPTVGLVWERSEVYRQGFRQGDVILQIDNTAIHSFAQFRNYPFIANQTYTVTVRDKNGIIKQLKLTK